MKQEKIILIGGTPTAGKSYTARRIAEELKLPWISTDTIREQMKGIVRKKDYPNLFFFHEATPKMAVKFFNRYSSKKIIRIINHEGKDVWKGVKALINSDYVWKSYIVEGVAILPSLISEIKNKNVKVLFLVDENIKRVRRTIFTRGLWDDAGKYPDSVKEKEVEWVIAFNEFIKKEAGKYGFPIVDLRNRKDYFKEIKRLIK